ncbi:unnamed protein product [Kluyveromyces dobzhanskii CBS 2104]|uniref:WGS project CCBQ000000000 data, contig 00107 n=1 Tax=Kluyveromyces dobzhanskii CBS 2104 TaxID=1427455 RepID=A0A0A8L1K9_9SACH|nr:unnamed protein product [Kluyveromyces dobzhanskii CBS 2104]
MSSNVITGANGRLDVYISKAKDLPNLRKLDKQDPFVKLRIAHLTETSPVIYRGGQTPKFDYHCIFQLTPDIKPLLCVELYDDHDHKHGSKLIGKCETDLLPALLSDPEEGHDRWYELKRGSLEAGKVYIELTFTPNNISESRHFDILNEDPSINSRTMPPLPSDLPELHAQYRAASSTNDQQRLASSASPNQYTHGSRMKYQLPELPVNFDTSRSSYASGEPMDLDSSVRSNATANTYHSQQSQSTEGLMDKLKLIKEKLNYFKNGSSVPPTESATNNAMDLEVLQKVVGAGLESSSSSRIPTNINEPSPMNHRSTRPFAEPSLPPLPASPSRLSSSSSVRHSAGNITPSRSPVHKPTTPKLPNLPTSFSASSSRSGSVSPTRRRPPPT